MAGYRRAGTGFTNATTINDQIDSQREAYQARTENSGSERGIGNSNVSELFNMPEDVFEESVKIFDGLDFSSNSSQDGNRFGNPDFQVAVALDALGAPNFDGLPGAEDKPNRKGPNLAPPDLDALIAGSVQAGSTEPVGSEHDRAKGFGWRDNRNEPGNQAARIGTYFSRHYNSTEASDNKPILGEAKSPAGDTLIDYDQP